MKKISHIFHSEYAPLTFLIIFNIVIGILTLSHYGESWDEFNYYFHAQQSLSAYTRLIATPGEPVIYDPTYRFYGPSFVMLIVLASKLFPGAILSDVAHGISFLTFQIGLILLYLLARRWLRPYAAFGATLLFASQPLLWGHAFINPKDTSFMVGFLASVYFGVKMADAYPTPANNSLRSISLNETLSHDWPLVKPSTRRWLAGSAILVLILAGSLTTGAFWLRAAYFPPSFYDPSTIDLERYLYGILTVTWQVLLFISLFLTGVCLLFLPLLPTTRNAILQKELQPLGKQVRSYLKLRPLVLAGMVLGFSISTRFFALAAAGCTGLYVLWKHGRASLVYITTYLLIAVATMFITWPYLWGAPVFRYILTTLVMLRYPWAGELLFNGQYFMEDEIPRSYLPRIISLQLTEPVLLLGLLGFSLLVILIIRRNWRSRRLETTDPHMDLLYWVAIWFIIPIGAAVTARTNLYDNFRQLHFILPPLFLLVGLSLHYFADKVKSLSLQWIALAIVILPGVSGIIRLFPYEYTYYNALARQPFRRFEMDYWGTSFREAADFLNANVPDGGSVVVWGPVTTIWPYLRTDMRLIRSEEGVPENNYYALISTRNGLDLVIHPGLPNIFTVKRGEALLTVIRKVP